MCAEAKTFHSRLNDDIFQDGGVMSPIHPGEKCVCQVLKQHIT